MLRRVKTPKAAKPKEVPYERIDRDSDVGRPMYALLDRLLEDPTFSHLHEARVALVFAKGWKADTDGIITLGKCMKASDLSREFAPFDFVIQLHKLIWLDVETTDEWRERLLFHELMHAEVAKDPITGEAKRNERGLLTYRIRKHDVEEFVEVVDRYGWMGGAQQAMAARIIQRARTESFTGCKTCVVDQDPPNAGWVVVDGRMARCDCWRTWCERRAEALAS